MSLSSRLESNKKEEEQDPDPMKPLVHVRITASDRSGINLKGAKDFCLKAKARIWRRATGYELSSFSVVEPTWHIQDSHGQILALAFR